MSPVPELETLIGEIRRAFSSTPRPADPFLAGSRDGCEPEEAVAPFRGREWASLDASMLDANYDSLSFFSEGALRYFMPAYLIADVRKQLRTADPVFHLTHGLTAFESSIEVGGRVWIRRHGGDALLNPRRYGAITWRDHARFRLSVFSREEAAAIVAYLEWRASDPERDFDREAIGAAVGEFWRDRARSAPASVALEIHVAEELAFSEACARRSGEP
jgi:hypothetical protein